MTTAQTVITAEELAQMPEDVRYELVQGELTAMAPVGGEHGGFVINLGTLLRIWVQQGVGGYVGTEAGFILARNPDTVRAPDVCYVHPNRIPSTGIPRGYWAIPPDLAVEVVSPSESADDVYAKVHDYLAAGTPLVWVLYPSRRVVIAYTPDGLARTFHVGDELRNDAVLSGFRCKVAEVFG